MITLSPGALGAGLALDRREFITLFGGAVLLPPSVHAQQPDQIHRIGVLALDADGELAAQQRAVFRNALMEMGWTEGKNVQIDYRWAANDMGRIPSLARELLGLKPDVILAQGTWTAAILQRATETTPIILVSVVPTLNGAVASLSHRQGKLTGLPNFEPTLLSNYVDMLKEISPIITAVAVMSNPDGGANFITRSLLEAVARHHGIELNFAPAHDASEIEQVISGLRDDPTKGLFVAGDPLFGTGADRAFIPSLATRYQVRAIYSFRHFVEAGGLIFYGNDLIDQYRQAATYADRVLKRANEADGTVQAPSKFEMVINLKAAKALGVTIQPTLLARADAVVE